MNRHQKVDVPSWVLNTGERAQQAAARIPLNWLIDALAGSSSPAYMQVEWHRVSEVISAETDEPAELPIALGDPNASILAIASRFKRTAAILGARAAQVTETLENYGRRAKPAVAYTYRGQTHAGILRGTGDLRMQPNSPYYHAAMRMGRNDVPAGIGVWLPEERVLLRPKDAVIVENNVPISNLPASYPGVTLV